MNWKKSRPAGGWTSFLGCRDGAIVRALASHQCGQGSIPRLGVICGLSLLVLYSAPRGFFPGTAVFPSPQKPTFNLICVNLLISVYSVPNKRSIARTARQLNSYFPFLSFSFLERGCLFLPF